MFLTAVGQALTYTGEVRNARGNPIAGYAISWSSSNAAAVGVTSAGVATATGYGSSLVIGRAGGLADTVTDVVVNPTRVIVDNGLTIAPRFGTRRSPCGPHCAWSWSRVAPPRSPRCWAEATGPRPTSGWASS